MQGDASPLKLSLLGGHGDLSSPLIKALIPANPQPGAGLAQGRSVWLHWLPGHWPDLGRLGGPISVSGSENLLRGGEILWHFLKGEGNQVLGGGFSRRILQKPAARAAASEDPAITGQSSNFYPSPPPPPPMFLRLTCVFGVSTCSEIQSPSLTVKAQTRKEIHT